MTPDVLNGLFELCGAAMIWLSIRRMVLDRSVRGFSPWSTAFFTAWGYWNLFFYAHLGQPFSLAGAVCMVLSNTVWLVLILRSYVAERRRRAELAGWWREHENEPLSWWERPERAEIHG